MKLSSHRIGYQADQYKGFVHGEYSRHGYHLVYKCHSKVYFHISNSIIFLYVE